MKRIIIYNSFYINVDVCISGKQNNKLKGWLSDI